MTSILVVAPESGGTRELMRALAHGAYTTTSACDLDSALASARSSKPDMVIADLSIKRPGDAGVRDFIKECQSGLHSPVLALIPAEDLDKYEVSVPFEDFILTPFESTELMARVERMLHKLKKEVVDHANALKFGDLLIDLTQYEVFRGDKRLELTFKEYELLKFLATSPGKVFTREILLNRVWGYDYFGGTRTVDVHIRRLRSKIEDSAHSFIDTVRNVGYRFREGQEGTPLA